MRCLLLSLFVVCAVITHAQTYNNLQINSAGGNPFMEDANGRPLYQRQEYRAEGSPYLFENYCLAEITAANGTKYPPLAIKINCLDNHVIYQAADGTEMIATTPISEITLYVFDENGHTKEKIILRGTNTALNTRGAKIYQVISEGKATLLKELKMSFIDTKGYGEATTTRTFTLDTHYYARLNTGENDAPLHKVERSKSGMIELFNDRQKEIGEYIARENIKCKSQKEMQQVFDYYNGLASK